MWEDKDPEKDDSGFNGRKNTSEKNADTERAKKKTTTARVEMTKTIPRLLENNISNYLRERKEQKRLPPFRS